MVNSFSWACRSCGEYNVVDLKDRSTSLLQCGFCFQPIQGAPTLESAPHVRLSDEWLGDEILKPLFGGTVRET